MTDRPLQGRIALVTGSTSGIGLGVAEALARAGADVALNGLGDAAPALERVGAHQTRVEHVDADLMDAGAAHGLVGEVERRFGRLDILVNNAGMQHVAPVHEFPPEQWDRIVALNLSAVFHTTRAAVRGMKARGWGRLIAIASAHGLVASPHKSAYVATKHAVVGFQKAVALELAETAITANAICPGYVKTPLVEGQIADQARANAMNEQDVVRDIILAAQPTKRFVEAEHIGRLAVFLATDAGCSVTGAALAMDGGWTAR